MFPAWNSAVSGEERPANGCDKLQKHVITCNACNARVIHVTDTITHITLSYTQRHTLHAITV